MWTPVVKNDCTYLVKFTFNDNTAKIIVTDLKKVWKETLEGDQLYNRFKDLNPLLEFTLDDAISQISTTITSLEVPTTFEIDDNEILMSVISTIEDDLKIRFNFHLTEDSSDTLFTDVTVPLIHTIQYLELKQKQLFELLKKKDEEIREYQLEKGQISRESRVTAKFDSETEKSFSNDMLMLQVFTKSETFMNTFGKSHGNILSAIPELQTQNKNKKRKLNKPYMPNRKQFLIEAGELLPQMEVKKEEDETS